MPKRENSGATELLLKQPGEFFPFNVFSAKHVISKFDRKDKDGNVIINRKTGQPEKQEQIEMDLETHVDGTRQTIRIWVGNYIPAFGKTFGVKSGLKKMAEAFGVLDKIYELFPGYDIGPEEVEAFKKLFDGKVAEGLIAVEKSALGNLNVKIETWRAAKGKTNGKAKKETIEAPKANF